MGRPKFNDKPLPGDYYVTCTHQFADLVFQMCNSLPKKWRDYILNPIFTDADLIDTSVTKANKVYMDAKVLTPGQLLNNLEIRMSLLDGALRTFDSFDRHFDRLMNQFDLLDTDFRYMYAKIKEAMIKADPEKAKTIKIHGTDNFFSYTADFDGEKIPVHFTRTKKDRILAAEALSKQQIGNRLSNDRKYRESLSKNPTS